MNTFPQNLRAARERRHLSVEEAAELCGLSRATWFNYEAGRNAPPLLSLLEIAEKLGTTAEKLLRGVRAE